MARLDFSGLRDELVLDNLPTDKYPEGKTYTVREPRIGDVERFLEVFDDLNSGDEARAKAAGEAFTEFLTVDGKPVSLLRRLLGETFATIEADGLAASTARVLEHSLITTCLQGSDVAQAALKAVIEGEAPARPNRAARRSSSSSRGGSKSSRASTGTRGRTKAPASTRSSATSEAGQATATG